MMASSSASEIEDPITLKLTYGKFPLSLSLCSFFFLFNNGCILGETDATLKFPKLELFIVIEAAIRKKLRIAKSRKIVIRCVDEDGFRTTIANDYGRLSSFLCAKTFNINHCYLLSSFAH